MTAPIKSAKIKFKLSPALSPPFRIGLGWTLCSSRAIYGVLFSPDGFDDIPADLYKDKTLHSMFDSMILPDL